MSDIMVESTVQLLDVSAIRPDPLNIRSVKPNADDELTFYKSVAEIGVRMPIIVKPDPLRTDGCDYVIVAGARRWDASVKAGFRVVPAIVRDYGDDQAAVDQVVENAVRADMHPVDQWRCVKKLMDAGYNLSTASATVGISERAGRRLLKLTQIHPDMLAAFAKHEVMPNWDQIATIAMAPAEVQTEAFKLFDPDDSGGWWRVANACDALSIPKSRAIFDVDAWSDRVQFTEDLFAQPDDDDRFSTTDIPAFLKAQEAALQEEAQASKGRISVVKANQPVPDGWRRVWAEQPEKWKKTDRRRVLKYVAQGGYNVGQVTSLVIEPIPGAASVAADHGHPDVEAVRSADLPTPAPRDPITKAGYDILALAKREAVKAALAGLDRENVRMSGLVELLLLAISARNVKVHGDPGNSWHTTDLSDVQDAMIDPNGDLRVLSPAALVDLATDVVGRIVVFDSPKASGGSGPVAEWIGAALKAANNMPRMDTPEFLVCCNASVLRDVATQSGITHPAGKSAKELRLQIAGHAPGWVPVQFGMRGPTAAIPSGDDADTTPVDDEVPDFDA